MVGSSSGGVCIEGEVWDVGAECLARLDDVEGVSLDLYRREAVQLLPPFDASEVQTYLYQRDVTRLRDCGSVWLPKTNFRHDV
jgi:gamma-glutamylcyclotransferase (GGCT)/AIG2-like uncharacterized protein YtfP